MLVIRKNFRDMMLSTDNGQELPGVQVGCVCMCVKGWSVTGIARTKVLR